MIAHLVRAGLGVALRYVVDTIKPGYTVAARPTTIHSHIAQQVERAGGHMIEIDGHAGANTDVHIQGNFGNYFQIGFISVTVHVIILLCYLSHLAVELVSPEQDISTLYYPSRLYSIYFCLQF